MVAETSSRGRRLFPEIQIRLQTGIGSSEILLQPIVQIGIGSAVTVVALALVCLIITWIGHDRIVAEKEAEVVRAETANANLHAEVAVLRGKLAGAVRDQEGAPPASSEEIAAKVDKLVQPTQALEQKHSQREILRPDCLVGAFRLAGLMTTELGQSEGDPLGPETLISDAPTEPAGERGGVAEFARRALAEFARVLASTGLDVQRLFPQVATNGGEGGPFVVPPKSDPSRELNPDQLEAMRSLIRSLPLSPPLDYYQLESRFGPRRDPFNRRMSFHTGIDLSAPYMSPVYATAPGTVIYAGYRADYGKVVEISHGNGIATVYGHLHRYIVSVGQTVAEHTQIGFLGSTGRSSGPHVHYEILVNDEPQDPEKFLGLARVIPAADR
jgi:murein DD-endopeptidase MepM/ murein hydrolase activator NlpD